MLPSECTNGGIAVPCQRFVVLAQRSARLDRGIERSLEGDACFQALELCEKKAAWLSMAIVTWPWMVGSASKTLTTFSIENGIGSPPSVKPSDQPRVHFAMNS